MRNAIAICLAGLGGLTLTGAAAGFAVFWVIEIIPFFWSRGEYMPAVLPAAVLCLFAGINLYKDPRN